MGLHGLTSYHVHSRWSDGRATIPEMIAAAENAGLDEIGLSDHFCLTPFRGTNAGEWSMPENGRNLERYVEAVRAAAREARIPVRLGVEADFFPETQAELRNILAGVDWDYVIGSVHYVDRFPIDFSPTPWQALTQEEIDAVFKAYYERMRDLARSGLCDFLGHLDLPKKFGFTPRASMESAVDEVLKAAADAGVALEMNTAGWDKACGDAYPAAEILHRAREYRIPVVLTADAHRPEEIARHYAEGVRRLREAGYRTVLRFENRRAIEQPLPEPPPSDSSSTGGDR